MPRVNMGRLSVVASHKVNGVSALHSELLAERLFPDYAALARPLRECHQRHLAAALADAANPPVGADR